MTSPYMESTMTKVSPVVEMVSPMVDSVKTRVEEQLMTHIPTNISETVQTVQAKAVDQVIAAVEKVKVRVLKKQTLKLFLRWTVTHAVALTS